MPLSWLQLNRRALALKLRLLLGADQATLFKWVTPDSEVAIFVAKTAGAASGSADLMMRVAIGAVLESLKERHDQNVA